MTTKTERLVVQAKELQPNDRIFQVAFDRTRETPIEVDTEVDTWAAPTGYVRVGLAGLHYAYYKEDTRFVVEREVEVPEFPVGTVVRFARGNTATKTEAGWIITFKNNGSTTTASGDEGIQNDIDIHGAKIIYTPEGD